MIEVLIRPAEETDGPFVFSTWLKNYRQSDFAKPIRSDPYFQGQHARIEEIISRGASVLIASPPDDPETILGYLVSEENTLHYMFVKQAFREMGVAKALIAHAALDLNKCSFTHLTPSAREAQKRYPGLRYNPFLV